MAYPPASVTPRMPETPDPEPCVITDALLVTQDPQRRVLRGDLRIEKGRFTHVGPGAPREGAEIIDGHRFAAVPGFINTHGHVAMAPLRGIADDRDLGGFLDILFRVDADRTEADVEAGARSGIAEMLLSGTTSFLDMYYFQDAAARAAISLGARAFLGWAVLDRDKTTQSGDPVDNAAAFIRRWKGQPRIEPLPAPQGVYVCGEETWRRTRELADREKTLIHYHLSETLREVHDHEAATGRRPAIWLEEIGFLGPGQIAAHGVWLTRREIEILAHRGVGIAHCASSNAKLATGGVSPVTEFRRAGGVVGIGTDSVASNNSLSMLREMHVAGLFQKHHRWEAGALSHQELLDMATIDGARLLGRASELGSLEVGKIADLSLFCLNHPTLGPARTEAIVSHLAYAASEEAIDSVYVGGARVVQGRSLTRASWEEIRSAAETAADTLWSRRPTG